MLGDTIHPTGILNAAKLAIAGFVANCALLFTLNERGTAGAGGDGDGSTDDASGTEGKDAGGSLDAGTQGNGGAASGVADTGDWRAALAPEIKEHPVLKKYKTKDDAVRALVEAQKLIGAEKIPLPGKDATDDDWNEVFNRLGRPESADKYTLPEVQLPEGMPVDENIVKGFKEQAHKYGLMPKQVEGLYKWFMEQQSGAYAGMMTQADESFKASEAKLKTEFGAAYKQNIDIAHRVVQSFGDKDAIDALNEGKGNDPRLIRMFVKIGKAMSEDKLQGKPKGLTLEPNEARAEIQKIKGDLKHPLWIENHPEHKLAVEKWNTLHALANPDTTPA